VSREA